MRGADVRVNHAGAEVQGSIDILRQEAMTRVLAVGLGRDGIRVGRIRPEIVPSELRGLTEEQERARFEKEWVTGVVVDKDGGSSLGPSDPNPRAG